MVVFVADPLHPRGILLMRDAGLTVHEGWTLPVAERDLLFPTVEILIVRGATIVDAAFLARLPRVRLVTRAGAGVDNIDVAACDARGIRVMNTPGANSIAVAELAIALILSLLRRIPDAAAQLRSGVWDRAAWVGAELYGKTLGVVGFGRIGRAVAVRAAAFGSTVIAFDPAVPSDDMDLLRVEPVTFDDLLRRAHIVTIHVPLTAGTRHLLDADALARLGRGALIVNTSRGGIIDEDALLAALESGHIAGAALDVYASEPPPADSPLLHHPRVIPLPHIGGSTVESKEHVSEQVARQVIEFVVA